MNPNENLGRLNKLALDAFDICLQEGWSRDWEGVGCYLHLEVSEYIEAKRGKRRDGENSCLSEAADILFVLLSSLVQDSIGPEHLVDALAAKVASLKG